MKGRYRVLLADYERSVRAFKRLQKQHKAEINECEFEIKDANEEIHRLKMELNEAKKERDLFVAELSNQRFSNRGKKKNIDELKEDVDKMFQDALKVENPDVDTDYLLDQYCENPESDTDTILTAIPNRQHYQNWI